MMQPMRVLLAIDESPHSAAALDSVLQRPWPADTVIRVMSVVPVMRPAATELWYIGPADIAKTEEVLREHALDLAARSAERIRSAGVAVEQAVRTGDPRTEIVDEAAEWNASLVVVGSHGYSGIKRILLGSVAQYVVSHAPCSVEVVRAGEQSH